MKKMTKFLLAIVLSTSFCSFGVFADTEASPNTYESNNALLKEKYGKLLLIQAENVGSAEGRNVNNYFRIKAASLPCIS